MNGNHNECVENMHQTLMQNHVSNNIVPSVAFDFQFTQVPHFHKPMLIPQEAPMYIPKQSPLTHAMNMNGINGINGINGMNGINMTDINLNSMGANSYDSNISAAAAASSASPSTNNMNFTNVSPLTQDVAVNNNFMNMQYPNDYPTSIISFYFIFPIINANTNININDG